MLKDDYVLVAYGMDQYNSAIGALGGAIDAVCNSSIWDLMIGALEDIFNTGDSYTQKALEYASDNIEYLISNQCDQSKGSGELKSKDQKAQYYNSDDLGNFVHRESSRQSKDQNVANAALNYASVENGSNGYIGLYMRFNCGNGRDDDSDISAVSVNLSSVLRAYLTYFADYMNGIADVAPDGKQVYEVTEQLQTSCLVDESTMFTVKIGQNVSSDALAQATFFDALFNQICLNGWTENNEVMDKEYMRDMLQTGKIFISQVSDDGFYYQGNYATDSYIKEIADETLIAYAESKYNTEKAKLNSKEETLDLKMKNLDTEISSLTTEYDTVKNTISKNIDTSFKCYSA